VLKRAKKQFKKKSIPLVARAGGPEGSYTIPGKGTTTRTDSGEAKAFIGKGPAPSGTTKVVEPSYTEVPTVTVTDSGVSTSGFKSQRAAKRAKRAQRASVKRVQRIVQDVQRDAQKRSLPPKVLPEYKAPKLASYAPKPDLDAKPPEFQGLKTAGTPTLGELKKAEKTGTLHVNQKGFATTPQVRQVAGKVKRLTKKAAKSNGLLPGLDAEGTKVARKVLKTGKRQGATRKELLAAAETGLVESGGFHNYNYGDADSEGWRQERTSLYGSDANHPKQGALNFFSETKAQTGATAGELAANVQRPAEQYRGRYDEVKPQAAAILNAFEKGGLKPAQRKELREAQLSAEKLGLHVKGASKVGPAPKKVVTRFKAAKKAMKEVEGLPYVWGGGHTSPTSSPTGGGLDCSGAVGYVLNKIGAMKGSLTSGDMGSVLKPGPGALTVFYNGEHTFLRLGNEYWGTSVGDSGAGGLGPHDAPSADYLAEYNVGHVFGLGRKQALQMGFKDLGSSQSFPGMTLSPSGTTATMDEGTTKTGKPGFSKKPIRLSPQQKLNRTNKKLKSLGVGDAPATPHSGSVLADLERKYSVAA
jgi:cell wall-associated NlpC family hydrolase